MPGIHPSSRRQVRYAFAAERRGEFPKGKAREWAHNWKCWTSGRDAQGKIPPGCRRAIQTLESVRRQHPSWKVPKEILVAEHRRKVIPFPKKAPKKVAPLFQFPVKRRRTA